MRNFVGAVAVALALSLTGCIQETTLIKVKPDGSGTVEITSTMSAVAAKNFRDQMKQMAAMGGDKKAEVPGEIFSVADAKAKVEKMGEGVTFVKSEPIKTEKVEGLKAIYAFTDINKLGLSTAPSKPKGAGMDEGPADEGEQISFKLTKQANGNALLTVAFTEKPEDPAAKKEEPKPEQMMMMKQFFQGLHIAIQVEPSTPLVKTNAPGHKGNIVTLMEVDMDQLMKDDANFMKFAKTQSMGMTESAKALKGVPGVKIPETKEITIEFGGK